MAVLLIAIFVGAGLLVVLAGMALVAAIWLLYMTLRLCVVRPVRRGYRQYRQHTATRTEVTRIERQAASAVRRLEAAAAQARADMRRRTGGR
ncbi:hypothetical protein [Rhodococcus aetherivorans]|uniref:hypothetical protein n=1 Tax=Rhodococcus aetherivorans TaxID=191292 RepID=UPI00294A50EF|nr:hypothetical protein [Rhodococcus aetherivorans]MDV6291481.1 hypothetical protein [Rhodococcus aetherivorans]